MNNDPTQFIISLLVSLIGLGIFVLIGGIIFQLLSLPFHRQERARLFVDLLEGELKIGNAPEPAILRLSKCQDPSLSVRFFILAAYLEKGLKLDEALDRVPRFLPAGVRGIIQAGYRLGNLRQLLPACRYQLQSAAEQVAKARNYLGLTIMILFPAWIVAVWMIGVYVLPRFHAIAEEMTGGKNLGWAMTHFNQIAMLAALPVAFVALAVLVYSIGPRLRLWFQRWLPAAFVDRMSAFQPWVRSRARRDFSLALARMLDAGVPESDAVRFAGTASGNDQFAEVAGEIATDLAAGATLPDALGRIDPAEEFKWRWNIAAQSGLPFEVALEGWHETLNARAVQNETGFANLSTTILILMNGLIVGLIVVGVFQFMIGIIEEALLW